jgi:hypothetical protein
LEKDGPLLPGGGRGGGRNRAGLSGCAGGGGAGGGAAAWRATSRAASARLTIARLGDEEGGVRRDDAVAGGEQDDLVDQLLAVLRLWRRIWRRRAVTLRLAQR